MKIGVGVFTGLLVTWLFSRVIGIPPGERCAFVRPDLLAAGFELGVIAVVRRIPIISNPPPRAAGLFVAIITLTLVVLGSLAAFDGVGHFDAAGVHVH
jgi:hypothetical protein